MKELEEYLAGKYSPTSVGGYRYAIGQYLAWVGGEAEALGADYAKILEYIAELRKGERRARTLKNYVFGVKIYYHYLLDTGRRADHPCKRLRLRDPVDRSIRLDELYQPATLAELAERGESKMAGLSLRNRVIIGLLVYQALLVGEIVRLRLADVDLTTGEVYVRASVSNRARRLPLVATQVMAVHRYIEQDRPVLLGDKPDPETLIVTRFGKALDGHAIKRIVNPAGSGKRYLPLRIRQSVIANKLKAGGDVRVVQVFAGHRQIGSTEAYRQTELEQLRMGISKFHPLQ